MPIVKQLQERVNLLVGVLRWCWEDDVTDVVVGCGCAVTVRDVMGQRCEQRARRDCKKSKQESGHATS